MKQLMNKTVITLSLLALVGCSSTPSVSPSEGKALNSISKSNISKKKSYFFQKQIDGFVDDEWRETVLEDKEIKEKYEDKKDRSFTLQEFVDKNKVYYKKKENNSASSHAAKLESMPIIGK